jgi:hypothetical protein
MKKSMFNSAAKPISVSALVLSGLFCAGTTLGAPSPSAPNFSPNASVAWVTEQGGFKPTLSGAGPVMQDPAHPAVGNDEFRLTGKQPTFATADLSNPILQPWAREALRKRNERILAGEPGFGPRVSCWPGGVPTFLLGGVFRPLFIIQSSKEVLMILQLDHQIRRIYLDVPHSANVKPSWYGESVGHYEGDTLVVDTIGLNDRTFVDNFLTPHTDKLHIVERFRLIDGDRTLQANIHVEDDGAFTMPWDAIQRFKRIEPGVADNSLVVENDGTNGRGPAGPMLEESCAESNLVTFGSDGMPIPQAVMPDF